MKKLKKIHLKSVLSFLSEGELKSVVGGYDGSGTYDDPYKLPEVVIYGCRCEACINFEFRNNPYALKGADKSNNALMTPLGEYIWKEFILKHASCCPWYD
jgi:natural product precursor